MNTNKKLCDRCAELTTYNGVQQLDGEGIILAGFRHGRLQDILDRASSIMPCPLCAVIRDSVTEKADQPSCTVWFRWNRRSFELAGEFGHINVYLEINAKSIVGLGTMCLMAREGERHSFLGIERPANVSCESQ